MHVSSFARSIGSGCTAKWTSLRLRRHLQPAVLYTRMSDADSLSSVQSPSTSPRFEQARWTFDAEGEQSQLPLMEANEGEEKTVSNGVVVGAGVDTAQSWQQQDKADAPSRGRTNRKRSNAQQVYVCVVVWLVKPAKGDEASEQRWNDVQEVRRRYDQAYSRWTPHVTLIPPFIVPFQCKTHVVQEKSEDRNVDGSEEDESGSTSSDSPPTTSDVRQISSGKAIMRVLSKRIASICERYAAQALLFDEVSKFPLRRYDTYHLRPSADAEATQMLSRLQEELALHLPEAIENSRTSSVSAKFRRRQSYLKQQEQQHQQRTNVRTTSNEPVSKMSEPLASGLPDLNTSVSPESGVDQHAQTISSPVHSPIVAGELTFKPHLTLGQASQREKAEEIQRFAEDLVTPTHTNSNEGLLRVTLNSIQLMWKPVHQSGPYELFQSFPLSSPLADKLV